MGKLYAGDWAFFPWEANADTNDIKIDPNSYFQKNEISAINWFYKNESLMKLRHYHKEKKFLIEKLDRILKKKIFHYNNRLLCQALEI